MLQLSVFGITFPAFAIIGYILVRWNMPNLKAWIRLNDGIQSRPYLRVWHAPQNQSMSCQVQIGCWFDVLLVAWHCTTSYKVQKSKHGRYL